MNAKHAKSIRKIARIFFPDQSPKMVTRIHVIERPVPNIPSRPVEKKQSFHDAQSYKGCIRILSHMSNKELKQLIQEHAELAHIKL